MITTVCLNPAIDRTASVKKLVPGGLNRVISARSDGGGKGVNVALTLARLGESAATLAFLPEDGGRLIRERLAGDGVACEAVPQQGAVRVNLKLLDESTREITEVNESGPAVTEEQLRDMISLVRRHAAASRMMVFSGSMPAGCPADYYRTLMDVAAGEHCLCALDADAARLKHGLLANPTLIKPNLHELRELTGRDIASLADVNAAAHQLTKQGVKYVAVSMGGDGAYLTDGHTALFAPALKVRVGSTVGAGDAMLAGLCAALVRGEGLHDMLRLGVACAASSVMSEGTGLIDRTTCEALMQQVNILPVT